MIKNLSKNYNIKTYKPRKYIIKNFDMELFNKSLIKFYDQTK